MAPTYQRLFLTLSFLFTIGLGSAQAAPNPDPLAGATTPFFVTNGQVNAIARTGNTLYVGGVFTQVRYLSGNGVALATSTGAEDRAFPRVNGPVHVVIPDGSGGWYIGGNFTNVGGIARNTLAHIKADKTVDTNFTAITSGEVRALVKSGNTLYIGGDFTWVNTPQQLRNKIAAVDATTGALLDFNPDCKDNVLAMALSGDGSTLYVGGNFQQQLDPNAPTCGGEVRNHIAAINTSTGLATSWNPNADARVSALVLSGSSLYVGGDFQNIGGQARSRIAEIRTSDGTATNWNPSAQNGGVDALALSNHGTIYVGGSFRFIGSQIPQPTRNRIAEINTSDGTATNWDPNSSGSVFSIVVSGSLVYVGGSFNPTLSVPNNIGGQPRNHIAALNQSDGTATSWNPNLNATVRALALAVSTVYAGGEFDSAGGVFERNNLAAFDATTGAVMTAINPNVTGGAVLTMAALGNTLFFGGEFTCVGGTGATPCAGGGGSTRNRAAALDGPSGALLSWNPSANATVRALAVGNDLAAVYVGGDFTNIGSVARNRLAALASSGVGTAFAWNPCPDGAVHALSPAASSSGDKVYVAGEFVTIGGTPSGTTCTGGQARSGLAFLKGKGSSSNLVENWKPEPNGLVRTLLVGAPIVCTAPSNPANPTLITPVYVGGDFTCLQGTDTTPCSSGGGLTRNRIAAIKNTSSQQNANICDWNPGANGIVRALAQSGNLIFAGGDFTEIGLGSARNRLAALDTVTGRALAPIVGTPGGAAEWNPNANDSVSALLAADTPIPSPGKLYVGGKFSTIMGSAPIGLPRYNLAAFSFTPLVAAALPISRSVQVTTTATLWALVINADPTMPATGVGIAPNNFIAPSDFSYQAVDPIIAPPNTPITIPPGGLETFLLAITPSTTLVPSLVPFIFEGTNTNAAPQFNAVNTLLFSASDTPTPDPIAQPVTDTGGGILDIPGPTGTGYIAVATTNVGVGGTVTVEANTGANSNLQEDVDLTLCEINPQTAQCINPPDFAPSVLLTMTAGGTNAFLVKVTGKDTIPYDPALNRILIIFHDGPGTNPFGPARGGTSVAVRTQQ